MAIKFVDSLPTVSGRGRAAKPLLSDDDRKELEDNPHKWAQVLTGATSAQRVVTFVNANPEFSYASRNAGKTVKNSKGNDVATYDVYMCFDPDGKHKRK